MTVAMSERAHGERSIECDVVSLYLKDMGRFPVLSRDEERRCFQQIEMHEAVLARLLLRHASLFHDMVPDGNGENCLEALRGMIAAICSQYDALRSRAIDVRAPTAEEITENEDTLIREAHAIFRRMRLPDVLIDRIIARLHTHAADRSFPGPDPENSSTRRLNAALAELKRDVRTMSVAHAEAKHAKRKMVEGNLRLVISVARRYADRSVHVMDLIQEGNIGLLKAVGQFDYRRGYKFSTYAIWWIRQTITRALLDQGRTVRVPVHALEEFRRIRRSAAEISAETGRKATLDEIACRMELPSERVKAALETAGRRYLSLDSPIGDGDSQVKNFIPDPEAASPEEDVLARSLAQRTREILEVLSSREALVLRRRFGIGHQGEWTLEQLAQELGVTRERIRQIEKRALVKLRYFSLKKRMDLFLYPS